MVAKEHLFAYFLNILIFSHENIRNVENETREIIVENKL